MQPIMVRLVAVVVATAGTVGTLAQPVLAGTPSFAEIAVSMDADGATGAPAVEVASGSPAAAGMSSPAPVAGSLPAPILGPPEVAGADPEPAAAAPILGTPVGSRAAQSPVRPAPTSMDRLNEGLDHSRAAQSPLRPAPTRTDRLDEHLDRSRAAQSPVRLAPSVERATSARWDPVVAPQVITAADQVITAADQVTTVADQATPALDQVTAAEPGEVDWVVVKPGDSLWLLAERHLGDALRWPEIFELNAGQLEGGGTLRDPNLVHPGWRLRLPPPDPAGQPGHPDQPGSASPASAIAVAASAAPTEAVSL